MDIEKEKDAYLGELLERNAITQEEYNDIIFRPSVNAFDSNYLSARFIDNINWGWNSWQAAKADVAEGFVLFPREPNQKIYRTFYDAFNSANAGNTAQCFKVAYKAMIKAQEQCHD